MHWLVKPSSQTLLGARVHEDAATHTEEHVTQQAALLPVSNQHSEPAPDAEEVEEGDRDDGYCCGPLEKEVAAHLLRRGGG